jgi:DNA-binding protein HU-beta
MARTTGPLNKTDLAAAVAAELGVSLDDGYRALDAVINTIARTVTSGHDVTVTNFGTFRAVKHSARTARNPQTGAPVQVPVRAAVHFRVSPRLREVVRGGDPSASIRKRPSK